MKILSHEEAARRDQYCGVCRIIHYGNPPTEHRCVACDTVGYDCCFSGNTGVCARCKSETDTAERHPQLRLTYELWMYGSCNWDSGECRIQVRLSAAEKRIAEAHLKHLVGRNWIHDFAFNQPMEPSEGLENTLDTIARSLGEDGLKGVGHSGPVWLLKEEA